MSPPIYWLDFFAVIFAAGAVIEVWNKGSIFANLRAHIGALRDVTPPETAKGRVLELLDCPFCQSYHVPVYFLLALLAADQIGGILPHLVRALTYGWAATRLGNLLNAFLPNQLQYKPDPFDESGQ
jgi:hypothetical protein